MIRYLDGYLFYGSLFQKRRDVDLGIAIIGNSRLINTYSAIKARPPLFLPRAGAKGRLYSGGLICPRIPWRRVSSGKFCAAPDFLQDVLVNDHSSRRVLLVYIARRILGFFCHCRSMIPIACALDSS